MDNEIKVVLEPEQTEDNEEKPSNSSTQETPIRWNIALFYIISGVFLLIVMTSILNTYFFHLKVESAVVSAPIEPIVSPVNGYIAHIYIELNDFVKKGTPLLKIESIDLERELQLAQVKYEESQFNISYYQQLLENEQQRLKIYKKISKNRLISAQAQINISQQEALISQHSLERFKVLHEKKYLSEMNLEIERNKYDTAQEKLKNAEALYKMEKHSLKALNKGFYFTGNKTEGIERDLKARLEAAKKRAEMNQNKIRIYENLINKLVLKAPFDGKITQILKSSGNTTSDNKPLLFIEKAHVPKEIIAYLTQDEVIHIGHSNEVKIYIPSLGKTYHGRIVKIDRTDGFIDVIKAQYRWRDFQIDRSAIVNIEIMPKEQKLFSKQAFPGMPITVYFHKAHHFF